MQETTHTPRRGRGASGRITILVCGLLVVLVAVIGVTASAAYVTAQQRKLLGITDAAAAAAADWTVGNHARTPGDRADLSRSVRIDEKTVRGAVNEYLVRLGDVDGLDRIRVTEVRVEGDGTTARVRLRARIGVPWAAALVGGGSDVVATSWVRVTVQR